MEGSDHVTDVCPTHTVHEGLSLLPQERLELQDSLASCQYDTPISGRVEQRVLFEKYIYNYYLLFTHHAFGQQLLRFINLTPASIEPLQSVFNLQVRGKPIPSAGTALLIITSNPYVRFVSPIMLS